ncbi:MAG: DUF6150 family protein [Pseudomonadota bacterium]
MTRVFKVERPEYANVSVAVVPSAASADLLVYRNDQAISQANAEPIWSFVKSRINAHLAVYFVPPDRGGAQLRIAYVNNPTLAGWMRHHKLKDRLSRRYPEKIMA